MDWSTTDVFTGALVIITAIYAALTYGIMRATRRSVDAMEKQTEALTRPYITIAPFTLPKNPILFLRVANTGKTAAMHLNLRLDRPFYQFGRQDEKHNLATFSAFTGEISSLSPGVELFFALAQGSVIFADNADKVKTPEAFKVTATYSFLGCMEHTVSEETEVDLRPYRDMHLAYDPVVNELSEIKDILKKKVLTA